MNDAPDRPPIDASQLSAAGLPANLARDLAAKVCNLCRQHDPMSAWQHLANHSLTPEQPFAVHLIIHDAIYAQWNHDAGPPPAWIPTDSQIRETNAATVMQEIGAASFDAFHTWSLHHPDRFLQCVLDRLQIHMARGPDSIIGASENPRHPQWLCGAQLNIASSCFPSPGNDVAIVEHGENGPPRTLSRTGLAALAARVANGLGSHGFTRGDAVAICMPMTVEAVAIYLGIILAGGTVVSIADSFVATEIARRNAIADVKMIFTQDHVSRGGRRLTLYQRVIESNTPPAIVVPCEENFVSPLRNGDTEWRSFLADQTTFTPVECNPYDPTNILFSSGTTGDPKAIPWTHLTPIRAAADAHFHHDIHAGDVLAWPTNLGWMMGPWLIYASLLNRATIALYDGAPATTGFGRFVQEAGVTMLGVVPSLVRAWRESGCLAGCDWHRIKAFSSTGECSNAEDMLYLMSRASYKPIIEYCGGTEIGGGYITGTMVQPASPATFTTPALGTGIVILDDKGNPSREGELFIMPPSLGLSESLLNRDHDEVYFHDTPVGPEGGELRRHGDHMTMIGGSYYRAQGRTDDTMNLSGIKISSAEIERVVSRVTDVHETAAVAVQPHGGGPSQLVIYAVCAKGNTPDCDRLQSDMQQAIRAHLSPLFKIHDVVLIDALPRTASNKVIRRALRTRAEHPSL